MYLLQDRIYRCRLTRVTIHSGSDRGGMDDPTLEALGASLIIYLPERPVEEDSGEFVTVVLYLDEDFHLPSLCDGEKYCRYIWTHYKNYLHYV